MNQAPTLGSYLKKYWGQYAGGLLCLLAVDFLELYIPQLTGAITDGLTAGNFPLSILLRDVLLIILIAAGAALMRFGWRVLMFGASRRVERDLREDLYRKLTGLSNRFFQHQKTGDLMAYFSNDMDAIRMAVGPGILTTFDAIVMTLMVVIKMIVYVDLKLTLLAMLPLLVILFGGSQYGKAISRRYDRKQAVFGKLTDFVQESVSGIRIVKAFVQEARDMEAFEKVSRENQEANLHVVKLRAIVLPLLDGLIGVASGLTLLYGGYLVIQGDITLGKFVAFNTYVMTLVWPMIAAGESITMLSQGGASWKRVRALFAETPEVVDDGHTDSSITSMGSSVEFRDLRFRYADGLPEVFTGFTADIPAGATIGILGRTGSGKSTLVSLLTRLYNVAPGQIFIGGQDIRSIPLSVLRENIACVPQENLLFSDTIQSNIAFGTRTIDKMPPLEQKPMKVFIRGTEAAEEWVEQEMSQRESENDRYWNDLDAVMAAAKDADVHDNIMDFPHQYATVVGERGVTLSGGQKQRTAIARGLMKDAQILILDDALSAVDTDTEARILSALKARRAGKTTILIAHRISTVQNADQILLIENGICAESGTHQELLAQGGSYAKLYEQQQLELQLQAEKEALHAEQ
ncbi:MAG: ABC transporter ATP-binding protein [Oscillospiraceae bacterium]|nr:ABC transporter ATP-binding protein [Oscillospiraceae bacterium]